MRYAHVLSLAVAALGFVLLVDGRAAEQAGQVKELFNGRNLDGWRYYLADHLTGMEDVWSVKDGVLVCKGEPMGYIYTKQAFKNFRVSLEYRWGGEKPGNSGVLMRLNGKPMPLPRCLECQLQHGKAGDLYGFHGMKLAGDEGRLRQVKGHELGGDLTGVARAAGAENEPGQWNKLEVVAQGGSLRVTMNGKLVNEAKDAEVVAGPIGLQSEGGEVHFRNIRVETLPD
ncbi:MAG TPA: DUF1080 domain-containing protein [Phycisphaerae bacterium]|nr:DUF1080 domain-containing protein [Phycisphaerae bacterium]